MKSRQGVRYHALEALDVIDPETMRSVPADGETMGEVMFRGNVVMKGYLKNKAVDRQGVRRRLVPFRRSRRQASRRLHPAQGPLQGHHHLRRREHLVDRGRGRACSSIPSVQLAAVVAAPDDKWGETPCAFVELKPGRERHRGRTDRLVPRAARPLQMPAPHRFRRNPEDLDRQGAEIRACARGRARARRRDRQHEIGLAAALPRRAGARAATRLAPVPARRRGRSDARPRRAQDAESARRASPACSADLVGAPADATLDAIDAARRKVGRARDLDILPGVLAALDLPAEIARRADRGDRRAARSGAARPSRHRRRRPRRRVARARRLGRGVGRRGGGRDAADRRARGAPIARRGGAATRLCRAGRRANCMR